MLPANAAPPARDCSSMIRHFIAALVLAVNTAAFAADNTPQPPIIDAHFHVMPYMNFDELRQAMDRNGIRAAGGAGAIGTAQRNSDVAAALGARYIRATGQAQWISLKQEGGVAALENADSPAFKARLAAMETDLRDNDARVIGEIHVSTLNSAANERVYHKIRGDAPTLKAMFDLAGKYKRALNVHAEWTGDTARELLALAAGNREARLVWRTAVWSPTPTPCARRWNKTRTSTATSRTAVRRN